MIEPFCEKMFHYGYFTGSYFCNTGLKWVNDASNTPLNTPLHLFCLEIYAHVVFGMSVLGFSYVHVAFYVHIVFLCLCSTFYLHVGFYVHVLVSGPEFLRTSHLDVLFKRDVLRNFAKFTGQHLCQSLFFNKKGLQFY